MPRKRKSLADRFWTKVRKGPDCWRWTGHLNGNGYGTIRGEAPGIGAAPKMNAQRASWLIHFGPIPDGMEVMHICDNPACVRPDHLRLGTHADNMADMFAKGRDGHGRLPGAANPRARLNDVAVMKIREAYASKTLSTKQLAALFCVSQPLITKIVSRQIWTHLPATPPT